MLQHFSQVPKYSQTDINNLKTFYESSAKYMDLLQKYHRGDSIEKKIEKTARVVGLTTDHLKSTLDQTVEEPAQATASS